MQVPHDQGRPHDKPLDVIVIGAGFAGICMAIRLRKARIDNFLILEKRGDIGGTWRDNHYPGCACDVPSLLYSLSFEWRTEWPLLFLSQPQILAYLRDLVAKHQLSRNLRLGTGLRSAEWDERQKLWRITAGNGQLFLSRSIVSAIGALHTPQNPDLPGLSNFRGTIFHSAEWDHRCELRGKRVAVIGTGASAVQFVPEIAALPDKLHVFQRSAPWILPKVPNRPITRRKRLLMKWLPIYRQGVRARLFWINEKRAKGFIMRGAHVHKTEHMERTERAGHQHLEAQVSDPVLRAKLTPRDMAGCKRVLTSNDFYPALTRPNTEIVTDSITRVTEGAIVTADGLERPVDVIIFGTGFSATGSYDGLQITGRDGVKLGDAWREGMSGYYGLAIAGFPNFFTLLGPNSGLGNNSVLIVIEAQVGYIMGWLRRIARGRLGSVEVKETAQRTFNTALQTRMKHSVWQIGGCRTWYHDPTTGNNTALWPGLATEYCLRLLGLRRSNFRREWR